MNMYCAPLNRDEIKKLIDSGINCIMLPFEFHSARAGVFFKKEEAKELIDLVHENQCKVMVMMNRMYANDDTVYIKDFMEEMNKCGADYFYYHDPAVYVEAKHQNCLNKLVYNPDTLCSNSKDINIMVNKGIHGCVIAKELTLDQLCEIGNKTTNSMILLHGYLNMSYSKRRLLDCYKEEIGLDKEFDHRYDLRLMETTRDGLMPVYQDEQGTAIYTPYVQMSFKELNQLLHSNIHDFIIERNYMSLDAVCDAIKGYRAIEQGEDAKTVEEAYVNKYDYPFDSGYMYQKTTLVKVNE